MAGSSELERERANVPAGKFNFSLEINDPWYPVRVGAGVGIAAVGVGAAVGIAAFFNKNPQLVTDIIKRALEVAEGILVTRVQLGCILVELQCDTKNSFLLFMDYFETKNLERRLNMEFEKGGYNEELKVTITNAKEAYMHLEQLRGERAPPGKVKEEPGFETQSPRTVSNPPEVAVKVINSRDLPGTSKLLDRGHLPIDFLLLTVNDWESNACFSFMENYSKMYEDSLGPLYVGNLRDSDGKMKIAVIKCKMGAAGPGGALGVVRDAVKALTPKAVFCVGCCGGLNRDKVKLGDVVISETLITYAPSKVKEGEIEELGHRVPLRPKISKIILSAANGWSAPLLDSDEAKKVKIQRGALLSGPQVVAKNEIREALIKRFPTGIAIEMEGEGLYASAHDLNVDWIIVKGVSNFADDKRPETNAWRPFASMMAASVVAHILRDTIVFEQWPHYNSGKTSLELPSSSGTFSSSIAGKGKGQDLLSVKLGTPKNTELETLANMLGDNWKTLGRQLFSDDDEHYCEARLTDHEKRNDKLSEKAYAMLKDWKQSNGRTATFQILYDALCHDNVKCKMIADKFCF